MEARYVICRGSASGYHFSKGAVSIGAQFSPNVYSTLGTAMCYSHNWADFRNDAEASVDSGRVMLYGSLYHEGLYGNAAVGGGYNSFNTKRDSFEGLERADGESEELTAYVSTGCDFRKNGFTFGPTASLQYTNVWLN